MPFSKGSCSWDINCRLRSRGNVIFLFTFVCDCAILSKSKRQFGRCRSSGIPNLLDGHDMCAMARTGSGKSAAFIIPMLQNLKEHSTNVGARALILSPTRDLALQTARFAKKISKYQSLRICSIIGGEAVTQQFNGLAMNPDIIIATPGRLSFLLKEIPTFNLHRVRHLVFDEADRLFELGFAVQIRHIMNSLSKDNKRKRQTMLFSATLPESVEQFSRATLTNPIMVRLDTDTKVSPDLQVWRCIVVRCH